MDPQHDPSGMLPYTEQPVFDYASFFQGDDDIIFDQPAQSQTVRQSDSSRQETPQSSDNKSSSNISTDVASRPTAQKQRLERRGHTKSRRGCFNCKRRRIKCQETRPACGHCLKTGLNCEYPAMPQIVHQPHNQIPLFSLQDMRFFQHFLTQCYPHHPLKQEDIWTHEIPSIAHNHEFLMHALLGLSASELMRSDPSLLPAAMNHRIKAIRAIKSRLSDNAKAHVSYEESNALVATCYALTFQSVALDDGLAEFMTFIRGIMIVGVQMMFRGIKFIFENMMEPQQDAVLGPVMENLPLIQKGWSDSASAAIRNLQPLCSDQVEVEYQEQLMKIVEKLFINSWDAYKQYTKEYGWWMTLPHETFQKIVNLDNQVMTLLHTHWIALTLNMAFITEQERNLRDPKHENPSQGPTDPGFIRWLKYLNGRVDYEHQMYNQWPMWVEEKLDEDMSFFGKRVS